MLKTIGEVSTMIEKGLWLHISGAEDLLRQLPKGNWIGGSIVYFLTDEGGITTDKQLFVQEIPYVPAKVSIYDENNIKDVLTDAYDNGFSIIILPYHEEVANVYEKSAPSFKDMYFKNIVGWVAGYELSKGSQPAIVVNGQSGEIFTDKAVVMHVSLPEDRTANIGIINMFTADENSPIIEFTETVSSTEKCLIDGKETVLAEYLIENKIDTRIPLIGAYYNASINSSFFIGNDLKTGITGFSSTVFPDIQYRFGRAVSDYSEAFVDALKGYEDLKPVFSCNCLLNYVYGELEGKKVGNFQGPVTFGEIAYQYMNQTMVYLTVE